MRILIINYEYPPVGGGAATAAEEIAKQLTKLGHRVVVLTGGTRDLPSFSENDGIPIHRVSRLRARLEQSGVLEMAAFLGRGLISLPGIIRKHQIDHAIVFFSLPSGPIGLLGQLTYGVPYIVLLRGGDVPGTEPSLGLLHRILTPIRRAVLRRSLAVVANSEGLKKIAEAADPFPVRLIPNGVDTNFFCPAVESRLGRSAGPLRILFVGRLREQKNLAFLFEQLARLATESFELTLVGDGPQKKDLCTLADRLGIAGSITWRGWLPRTAIPQVYQTADCVVTPSLYEGMSNVVLEAMASGLPVVASKVAGNDALVINGETGFLFELAQPDGMLLALRTLMMDPRLRREFGSAGRARAVSEFSWRSTTERYLELLDR